MTDAATRRQRALNRETAANFAHFAGHRQRVMELLSPDDPGRRLCVLGAGNCNDIDLVALVERFAEITLVDLDAESLSSAVARQPEAVRRGLVVRAPVNFAALPEDQAAPSLDPGAAARAAARAVATRDFDVVCSASVLSQLIGEVPQRWGAAHPRCLELVQFVRATHLNLMLELLRPGGRAVLVCDMVSSDSAPELASTPADKLHGLMVRLAASKNFFTGLNPFAVELFLQKDPALSGRIQGIAPQAPWIWRIAPQRSYLVFALTFTRR